MNWGIKIIFSFAIFAIGIITMVYISFSKNADLVNANYYEQEIKYQQHIDLLRDSKSFNEKVVLNVEADTITISLPSTNSAAPVEINFYRSSDAKKDFKVKLEKNAMNIYKIYGGDMAKGQWKVSIRIKENDNMLFSEKTIFLK